MGADGVQQDRDRLVTTAIARQFLAAILADKAVAPLLSEEHFSVDGTLVEAWASMKSFQPKTEADSEPPTHDKGSEQDGTPPQKAAEPPAAPASAGRNAEADFRGQKARTQRMHPSPIPKPGCIARARGRKPGSALWGMR